MKSLLALTQSQTWKLWALEGEKVQEKNQETKKDGGIGFKNFWNYIKASDTLFMFFLWIILKLGSVSLFVLSDLQYSKIGDVVEGKNQNNTGVVVFLRLFFLQKFWFWRSSMVNRI